MSILSRYYCSNITSPTQLYPDQPAEVREKTKRFVAEAGLSPALAQPVANLIGYFNLTQTSTCLGSGSTINQCFSTTNETFYSQHDISQTWRSWPYQFCTEWGYFQTGASVPSSIRPLISRITTIEWASFVCRAAFGIVDRPRVEVINRRGMFDIAADRLGFVDGEDDPWRPAGPHCDCQPDRISSLDRPWILIKDGVHHWDENGRLDNDTEPNVPPPAVDSAQRYLVSAVKKWHFGEFDHMFFLFLT